ncbi:MAG: hypothetical protein LBU65_02960 [Planctomycetaceae bacterium]|jgi:hypothetical protein|nr:hypothetical protein [Planctomycetaceae bacterium]
MADKKKKIQKPVVTEKMAQTVCEVAGLPPEQIALLLDSLSKIGRAKSIIRQSGGTLFRGRQRKVPIDKAIIETIKKANERHERIQAIREKFRLAQTEDRQQQQTIQPETNIYPRRVSPMDISRSLDNARMILADRDSRMVITPQSIRAEVILRAIERVKSTEVIRIAEKIALRQAKTIAGKTEKDVMEAKEAMLEKKRLDDAQRALEEIEKKRTLEGFGGDLHTLVDEAAEVVDANLEASAKILTQWIGAEPVKNDAKQQ